MSGWQALQKRLFDIVCAILGLLFLWPVILICALIARLDSGLSGFYSQRRVGRDSKEFSVYKVRSMKTIAGMEGDVITTSNDPRITKSGRFFRRWKLDELPQLWNVLVGDMSFVGPRPDIPGYADRLVGAERKVLILRPGITGPATIKYRGEEELLAGQEDPKCYNDNVLYPDKVKINLTYLDNWSLRGDIEYILMTFGIVQTPSSLSENSDGANG